MTEYYPGSKREKKSYPGKTRPSMPELGDPYKRVKYKNTVLDVFTIGQLATALGRKAVTLRKWETDGVIPLAPFELPGTDARGRRRLYSREHMEGILQIAIEEGVMDNLTVKIKETKFSERVLELFERLAKEL